MNMMEVINLDIKKAPITSLSAYVEHLEKNGYLNSNYIFRGEHCHLNDKREVSSHEKRVSGAFRTPVNSTYPHGSDVYHIFTDKIEKYYSQIGHRLSDVDREHFVAFSQHYGLTTNLLDVTASPMVALFFACYEESCCKYKKSNKNTYGKVYIFDNDSIDITLVLSEFQKRGIFNQDVFDRLSTGNRTIYNTMYDAFKKYIEGNFFITKKEYTTCGTSQSLDEPKPAANERICKLYNCAWQLYNFRRTNTQALASDLLSESGVLRLNLPEVNGRISGELEKHEKDVYFAKLLDGIMQDESMSGFTDINLGKFSDWWANAYLLFLIYILKEGGVFKQGKAKQPFCETCAEKDLCNNMPTFLPTLIYKPQITFERARLQKGYFIYQPYREICKNEIVQFQYNPHIVEIDIQNTDEILKQLDAFDVNLGTIFGDYDSIAKYIASK